MKKINVYLRELFKFVRFNMAMYRLDKATRIADALYKKHNRRFFVIAGEKKKDLLVIDRQMMRVLRRKNAMNKEVRVIDLIQESFYLTPCKNGNQKISDRIVKLKRKEYFKYVESF